MLFYLDQPDLSEVPAAVLSAAISDLVRAHRLGRHLVVMSRTAAAWVRDNVQLSQADFAMLERIAQDFAQAGDLPRKAKVFVSLTSNEELNLTVRDNQIIVHIAKLVEYRLLDASVLLVENMEADGSLYRYLFSNHCDLHECSNVSFDTHHGGGADLPMVFEALTNERRIVCGITDTDKNCPASSEQKLETLLRIKERSEWPLCFAMAPPCREAENMVPLDLVMQLPSGARNPTNPVQLRVQQQEAAQGDRQEHQYWYFFDIKEGVSEAKLNAMTDDERDWIERKLALAGVNMEQGPLVGYGDRVISQVFANNRHASELRRLTRQNAWRAVFSAFLEEAIWIVVAASRVFT